MSRQVFISYSRQDGVAHAERLEAKLRAAGYRVWRDTRNINPNQDFTAEIEMGIKNSDIVAVCVTPDLQRPNSFVRREIQYADVVQKPAFPCRIMDVPPPISIINREWLEFHKDWEAAFQRLLKLVIDPHLSKQPGTYAAPPDDPFRDYLGKLYQQIVRYLDQAVIKLIDLEAETAPDAVLKQATDDILLEFFESSVFADDSTDDLPQHTTFKEAFDYHKGRMLLLGEPGAGKTITLMSHARDAVAARLEDPSLPLPVLKIAATWKSNPPVPLLDWAAGKLDALKPVIAGGNALLLLDGMDELGGERPINPEKPEEGTYDPRKRFIDAVSDLPDANQVLVTCRVKDYAAIGKQIPLDGAITLQPLTDNQLEDYLSDHPEIYAAIQADEQLRDLARTPLLLSLITFAWDKLDETLKKGGDLRAGDVRDAIFEAYCRQRYEHEAKKRSADLPFTYDAMMEVLGELAMWNAQDSRPGKKWRDYDRKPEENVLIPYDFEYVLKDETRIDAFKKMTTHLNILAPVNDNDFRFVHLLLRDFLAYTFALPRLRNQSLWIEDSYGKSNTNPIVALGTIGDTRAIEPLISCLSDTDMNVRSNAVTALGKIGGTRAVEPLIACRSDEYYLVRWNAAKALGKIGDARAVEPLIACLRDEELGVRQNAAEALGKIGDVRAVEPLIACLRDESRFVRSDAEKALGEIGEAAVEPLIACLRDEDYRVRASAADALEKIGEIAVEPLIACLRDDDSDGRAFAARALGDIGNARAVEPLIVFLGDANSDVRENAADALGKIGDPRAVEPLIVCLGDANSDVRENAAEALGEIGDPRAVELLIACLSDEESRVRWNAADALGEIGWQPQTEDQEIQYLIASEEWNELIEKGGAAIEPLIACLRDENSDVRRDGAEALGKIGDPRAVEPLIACLRDEDNWVRGYAVGALGKIGDPRAVEPLIALLDDTEKVSRFGGERVCDVAYEALQKIGTPEALKACEDWVAAGNKPYNIFDDDEYLDDDDDFYFDDDDFDLDDLFDE